MKINSTGIDMDSRDLFQNKESAYPYQQDHVLINKVIQVFQDIVDQPA